jgi:hypothetical protein
MFLKTTYGDILARVSLWGEIAVQGCRSAHRDFHCACVRSAWSWHMSALDTLAKKENIGI